ncbi:MAG: hypothetical protein E7399_03645, partial [Ruminococcaceae bacterium]|nr:hypothetical protein [Oscillospiraceae bacterium]
MNRKITSLLLIAVMLLSCLSFPGFAADDSSVLYINDYSQTVIPDDKDYIEYPYSNTGSSWFENAAGSWAYSWILNDENSKDGNYFAVKTASQPIYFLTHRGSTETSATGRIATKKCFTVDFSFNALTTVPTGQNELSPTIKVNIFPEKSTTSNGRSGEGTILTIPVGGEIKVVDDATEKDTAAFATAKDVWYDVHIDIDQTLAVPIFSVSMKKSADAEYTVIAENISFPKAGNYASGLGMFSLLEMDTYRILALDDIKVETYEKKIAPTVSAVFAAGSGHVGTTLTGLYEYAGSPGEKDSVYEWLVCDTKDGEFKPIEGANAKTLSLSSELKGKFVKFRVTPVNEDGDQGKAVAGLAIQITEDDQEYGVDNLNNMSGDLKIAFIGGSITYGTGASSAAKRYSTQLVTNYFKKKFPNKNIIEINTGIGGTPSDLGLMRLNREISSQAPDVVFVEFAVNDKYFDQATAQRQYEGIVRQLLKLPKQPVVIPLYTCENGLSEVTADYQQEVAEYYGLGSVSFIEYIKENGG